jgi:hypothetical protein
LNVWIEGPGRPGLRRRRAGPGSAFAPVVHPWCACPCSGAS